MKLDIKTKDLRKDLKNASKCPKCGVTPAIELVIRNEILIDQESVETHYIVFCPTESCPMKGWSVEVRLSDSIDESLEKWEELVRDEKQKMTQEN